MSLSQLVNFAEYKAKQEIKHGTPYACLRCRDTGSLLARALYTETGPFAFKCDCPRGHYSKRAHPQWNTGRTKDYEVIYG